MLVNTESCYWMSSHMQMHLKFHKCHMSVDTESCYWIWSFTLTYLKQIKCLQLTQNLVIGCLPSTCRGRVKNMCAWTAVTPEWTPKCISSFFFFKFKFSSQSLKNSQQYSWIWTWKKRRCEYEQKSMKMSYCYCLELLSWAELSW